MTPHRSSVPEDKGQNRASDPRASMSWGARQSESESESRAESMARADDELVYCPSCGSEKTTAVQVANRGQGSSIRRDNPGFKCFACGTGWTVTIGSDRERKDAQEL